MRALYNGSVNRFRILWLAAAAALPALFAAAPALAQNATNLTVPAINPPVIRVQMRSGTLTIRTWDRPQVQIASTGAVDVRQFSAGIVQRAVRGGDIPIFSSTILTRNGPITLLPEEFPVPSLTDSPHDGIVVFGPDSGANVTLTVPSSTALLWAMVGRGRLHLQDYRNGAFVARVHTGALSLDNVSGAGYGEVARGAIVVSNSAFDRIRVRTAAGNILFTNCNARQIEVSSVNGSIAYDNGTFVPGLARFETLNGDVAIGVAGGGVQINAHAPSGQIHSQFAHGANLRGAPTDTQATVNGGGPVVTVSSQHGAIYLYDGTFRSRPQLQRRWQPRLQTRLPTTRTSARRPYRV
jgi:hypothetical protein